MKDQTQKQNSTTKKAKYKPKGEVQTRNNTRKQEQWEDGTGRHQNSRAE